jgi:hypothetical protein
MNSNPAETNGVANTSFGATGFYTKIGSVVTFSVYFDVTGYSNHVAYRIDGLPYVSRNVGAGYPVSLGHPRGMRFVYGNSILSNAILSATVMPGTSQVSLQASSMSQAFSGWFYISNEPPQGKYIHVAGSYLAN